MDFTGEDSRQKLLFLLLGTVLLQGRTNGLQCHQWHRHIGTHDLVHEDLLFQRAESVTTVFLGPTDSQPAVLSHAPHHGLIGRAMPVDHHLAGLFGGHQIREVVPQIIL
ncbi:Uncharacterised protein [Mycobacteroides abscessus subsp. abscessus]|nr:Uncharacterised protein [Mycobacteroides abscessus subsp. abscessus]SLD80404.1 Uncharacterised protein [Mycobacteroides abscessus subsp. massiliense]